jgi:nucleotide-binding universal stress UspA family protein
MFTHLLVPLDGSELAERALPVATDLARVTGATLHLVRVVEPLVSPTWAITPVYFPADVYERTMTEERQAATAYLEAARERLSAGGIAIQAVQLEGHVAATLLDVERDAGIDLVVLCSHGRSGLARFVLGSVAEQLVRHSAAPLLLVRAFGPPVDLTQVVVPLDGSARSEAALAILASLEPTLARRVILLRVIREADRGPEAERYLAAVAARLQPAPLECTTRVELGEPADRIVEAAGATGLVVMSTHGRTALARWALGSVADRVAHAGVAGVLLVRVAHDADGAGSPIAPLNELSGDIPPADR